MKRKLPKITIGIPSEILNRRPDIKSSLAKLQAASFKKSESFASLLPSLILTSSAGTSSSDLNDILDEVGVQPEQLGLNVDEQNEKSTANSLATDKLLASVDYDITAIDVIAQRNALSVSQAMASLLEYELRGLVAAVPGGYVKLRGK